MHRRDLLKAAGGLTAGAALGTLAGAGPAAASGPAADPQLRFDLAAPGEVLLDGIALHDVTVLQSLAFDNVNGRLYTAQLISGGKQLPGEEAPVSGAQRALRGDMCVTELDLDGTETGHMYLLGFGHGVNFAAEPVGSGAFLWTETEAVPSAGSGWGSRLARFRFVSGTIVTPDSPEVRRMDPVPDADRTTCGIDPSYGRLVLRYRVGRNPDGSGGQFRYALFDLSEVRRNQFVPLADVSQPVLGTFQGFTSSGRYLYLLDGNSYATAPAPAGNTYLTCVDWVTGEVLQRQFVTDYAELPFREPEGMAIQVPDLSRPLEARLCWGFATGVTGARRAAVLYKDTYV